MARPVILVVDDEESVRTAISDFLRTKFGSSIKSFSEGGEVLEFIKDNNADVIILDIKMPKTSGIDVIREVKAKCAKVDILVVSAWISSDVANEAICAGATDYIVKPVDLKVLELKVSDILGKRKGV